MGYYDKRDAKVRIARELEKRGWKLYGFREDQSDSMIDYYSPASWEGIATKDGFTLVIDNSSAYNSGKEITRYNPNKVTNVNNSKKIEALKNMTVERGCTEQEAENAKELLKKLQDQQQISFGWEIIGYYPIFQANQKGIQWHIEKDGTIYDQGRGLTIYSKVPASYMFDIDTMQFKNSYEKVWIDNDEYGNRIMKDRQLTAEEEKAVKALKNLILRFERVIANMNSCGDGTKETAVKAAEQRENEKMIKKEIKKTVKKVELQEVKRESELKINDVICMQGYGKLKVIEVGENYYLTVKLGSESRGYQESKSSGSKIRWNKQSVDRNIQSGYRKVYNLVEVLKEEIITKWVRSNNTSSKKQNNSNKAEEKATTTTKNNIEVEVKFNNEKKGIELYFNNIPSKEIRENLKSNGFRWSKFNKCWYHKNTAETREFLINLGWLKSEKSSSKEIQVSNHQEKINSLMENIIDKSVTLMEELQINYKTKFWENEEYKKGLLQYLKDLKINKRTLENIIVAMKKHEDYKNFNELMEVLKGFLDSEEKQQAEEKKAQEKEKLLSKIEKQQEKNSKDIERLSGNYKTNTWKRMREQESRDNTRRATEKENLILDYLKEKISSGSYNDFEKILCTRTFRTFINSKEEYLNYLTKQNREKENIYPFIHYNWADDNWVNVEVRKNIKMLQKANILNENQLREAIQEYRKILNIIEGKNAESEKQIKIKRLERKAEMHQKGDINFTPSELANLLCSYANIKPYDIVLEPSAGIGRIADILKEYTSNIDCIELYDDFRELLKLKGYNVIGCNTLEVEKKYSKIVMNPPFSQEQEHIKYLYENCLDIGGTLVSITSPHWTFANDKKSKEFRNWLNNLNYEVFESDIKFSHTNVNYKILVINKDTEIQKAI